MKKIFTFLAAVFITATTFAQVGINTKNPNFYASLDITSTTRGLLMPSMSETQRVNISSPANGLMVYQTNVKEGFYYYNDAKWHKLIAGPTTRTYENNTFYAELGGYVIEKRDGGKHGLVAAMQNQGTPSSWDLAYGFANDASKHDVNGDKFMDWRLPTKREMNLVYGARAAIGLPSGGYWSSMQSSPTTAWYFSVVGNNWQSWRKNQPAFKMRAVRAF